MDEVLHLGADDRDVDRAVTARRTALTVAVSTADHDRSHNREQNRDQGSSSRTAVASVANKNRSQRGYFAPTWARSARAGLRLGNAASSWRRDHALVHPRSALVRDSGFDQLHRAQHAEGCCGQRLRDAARPRSSSDVLDKVRANASYCPCQMSRGGEPGCRLDRASFVPLPQQLYPRLRERVLSGRVGEGAALGTERELKETFGVSCATVREAAPSHLRGAAGAGGVRGGRTPARPLQVPPPPSPPTVQAGEPDRASPALGGTALDASGQR
jgi:hypothetical protein